MNLRGTATRLPTTITHRRLRLQDDTVAGRHLIPGLAKVCTTGNINMGFFEEFKKQTRGTKLLFNILFHGAHIGLFALGW